jgi:hypothetical protein
MILGKFWNEGAFFSTQKYIFCDAKWENLVQNRELSLEHDNVRTIESSLWLLKKEIGTATENCAKF